MQEAGSREREEGRGGLVFEGDGAANAGGWVVNSIYSVTRKLREHFDAGCERHSSLRKTFSKIPPLTDK